MQIEYDERGVKVAVKVKHMSAKDKCDACGHQACVRVFIGGTELDFCSHHYNQHIEALADNDASLVYDERDWLERL